MGRGSFAVRSIEEFEWTLGNRLRMLKEARGNSGAPTVMPIALCVAVPEQLGGDAIAREMIQRFGLLNMMSRTDIDFYYFGWSVMDPAGDHLNFDFSAFRSCWQWLFDAGVKDFGGNADLAIVDAQLGATGGLALHFDEAISIDLSLAAKTGKFETLGDFLKALMREAREVSADERRSGRPVFHISDSLALTAMWEALLQRLLKRVGLDRVEAIVTRNLGPKIELGTASA